MVKVASGSLSPPLVLCVELPPSSPPVVASLPPAPLPPAPPPLVVVPLPVVPLLELLTAVVPLAPPTDAPVVAALLLLLLMLLLLLAALLVPVAVSLLAPAAVVLLVPTVVLVLAAVSLVLLAALVLPAVVPVAVGLPLTVLLWEGFEFSLQLVAARSAARSIRPPVRRLHFSEKTFILRSVEAT